MHASHLKQPRTEWHWQTWINSSNLFRRLRPALKVTWTHLGQGLCKFIRGVPWRVARPIYLVVYWAGTPGYWVGCFHGLIVHHWCLALYMSFFPCIRSTANNQDVKSLIRNPMVWEEVTRQVHIHCDHCHVTSKHGKPLWGILAPTSRATQGQCREKSRCLKCSKPWFWSSRTFHPLTWWLCRTFPRPNEQSRTCQSLSWALLQDEGFDELRYPWQNDIKVALHWLGPIRLGYSPINNGNARI